MGPKRGNALVLSEERVCTLLAHKAHIAEQCSKGRSRPRQRVEGEGVAKRQADKYPLSPSSFSMGKQRRRESSVQPSLPFRGGREDKFSRNGAGSRPSGKKARELYHSFFYPWPFAARSSAPPHLASPRQSAETEACPSLDFSPLLGRCLFTKDSLFSSTTLFLPFLLHSFFV